MADGIYRGIAMSRDIPAAARARARGAFKADYKLLTIYVLITPL